MTAIHVTLEIPADLSSKIAPDPGGLSQAALEGLALEGLRAGKFTVSEAKRLIGLHSRHEMGGFLKSHGPRPDLLMDDVRPTLTAITCQMKVSVRTRKTMRGCSPSK